MPIICVFFCDIDRFSYYWTFCKINVMGVMLIFVRFISHSVANFHDISFTLPAVSGLSHMCRLNQTFHLFIQFYHNVLLLQEFLDTVESENKSDERFINNSQRAIEK